MRVIFFSSTRRPVILRHSPCKLRCQTVGPGPSTDIASASAIQKHSDLRAQFAEGERLADHMHAGVEPAMMDDGVARIARREKHPQSGPAAYGFVGELTAIHAAGHDDVREQ